jgi:hypothetical protein
MGSDCRFIVSATGQKPRGTDLTGAACDSTIRDLILTATGNRQPACKLQRITDCLRKQLQINIGRPERRWSDRRWRNRSPTGVNLDRAEEEVDEDSKWWRKGNNMLTVRYAIPPQAAASVFLLRTWQRNSGSWKGRSSILCVFPLVLWFWMMYAWNERGRDNLNLFIADRTRSYKEYTGTASENIFSWFNSSTDKDTGVFTFQNEDRK